MGTRIFFHGISADHVDMTAPCWGTIDVVASLASL